MKPTADKFNVIRRSIVTEKAVRMQEQANKFVIEVDRNANKIQIRKAVEEIFNVKVIAVRTAKIGGKSKRTKHGISRTNPRKKAIVTLREGDAISYT